ncbi:MAG: ribonuclease H-like domain-containing protein [Alphaproteobacteria bacterium]
MASNRVTSLKIELHQGDLPAGLDLGVAVAIDTETTGLSQTRDRLCLAQLSAGDEVCHLVQFPQPDAGPIDAPNLKALLADPGVTKLFHYGRFDIAVMERFIGPVSLPVYCTKIASKLVRTYTDRHGLKDLCRDLLGKELSKQQQTSDWGADDLSKEQLAYAAADVTSLHRLRERLDAMLAREGRAELAAACFGFLPHRAELDLMGWDEPDIFSH